MNKLITTFVAATLAMGAAFAQTPATTSTPTAPATVSAVKATATASPAMAVSAVKPVAAASAAKGTAAKDAKVVAVPVVKKAANSKAAVETAPVK